MNTYLPYISYEFSPSLEAATTEDGEKRFYPSVKLTISGAGIARRFDYLNISSEDMAEILSSMVDALSGEGFEEELEMTIYDITL